jgi:HEAT repeat protein
MLPIISPVGRAEDDAIQAVRVARRDGNVEYLIDSLNDPSARTWAARYLGNLGATEAVPALQRLLRAGDPKARIAAADALGRLGAREAMDELIELAQRDQNEGVQSHAARALGELGDRRVEPVLARLLASPRRWVRLNAAHALGQLADEPAIPMLRAASRREPFYLRGTYRQAIRRVRRRSRS